MGNRDDFEKWKNSEGYARFGIEDDWHIWQARQPEIDAKDKIIDDQALQKGILKAEIGRLESENKALKAEVERVNKAASDAVLILRCLSVDPALSDSWREKADRAANGLAAMKETK